MQINIRLMFHNLETYCLEENMLWVKNIQMKPKYMYTSHKAILSAEE